MVAMDLYRDATVAEPDALPLRPGVARDAFAFIDLARLGRTDWWSGTKALLNIVGWHLAIGIPGGLALRFWEKSLPQGFFEVAILALAIVALMLGIRGALRSHRRPFLSLVSPALQLNITRVWQGAALWFAVSLVPTGLFLMLYVALDEDGLTFAELGVSWPHNAGLTIAALLCVALFPLQAAGEELIFRGWLTQTLGQLVRRRWLIVLIVGVLFALVHGFVHGSYAFFVYLAMSFGLSALTLRDQRIELAMGVHAANNIIVVLGMLLVPIDRAHPSLFLSTVQAPWWAAIVPCVQFTVVYLVLRWRLRRAERQGIAAIA
jgi:membrane protease YdiL (CAAX protease family)